MDLRPDSPGFSSTAAPAAPAPCLTTVPSAPRADGSHVPAVTMARSKRAAQRSTPPSAGCRRG